MGRYHKLESGETVELPPATDMRFRCCDCGLVHLVEINVTPRHGLVLRLYRQEQATARYRRNMVQQTFGEVIQSQDAQE